MIWAKEVTKSNENAEKTEPCKSDGTVCRAADPKSDGTERKLEEPFPQARGLRLEVGCGKGRFTVETASQNPECLFLAIERVADAMIIAMERAEKMGLHNVYFIDADAARLREYFAPGEVDLIYLNFSDSWPSNRHSKRRLTHMDFLMRYRQVLKEGGQIHFKTDNRDLYEWSLFQFPKGWFCPV